MLSVASGPAIQALDAQHDITYACVAYMASSFQLINPLETAEHVNVLIGKGFHALHHYASNFWLEHLLDYAALAAPLNVNCTSALALQLRHLQMTHVDYLENSTETRSELTNKSRAADQLEQRLSNLSGWPEIQCLARQTMLQRQLLSQKQQNGKGRTIILYLPWFDLLLITFCIGSEQIQDKSVFGRISQVYERVVRELLCANLVADLPPATLSHFKDCFGPSAFVCRYVRCSRSSVGFKTETELAKHQALHKPRFECSDIGCEHATLGFRSARALRDHKQKYHTEATKIFLPTAFRGYDVLKSSNLLSQESILATAFDNAGVGVGSALSRIDDAGLQQDLDFDRTSHADNNDTNWSCNPGPATVGGEVVDYFPPPFNGRPAPLNFLHLGELSDPDQNSDERGMSTERLFSQTLHTPSVKESFLSLFVRGEGGTSRDDLYKLAKELSRAA